MDYIIDEFTFKIRPDKTIKNKYYCVMQNPFNSKYDTKVLYGSSKEIVGRKIEKQYKKYKNRKGDK